MKILITGATGLVGTQLGLELVRKGHEIIVVSRTPATTVYKCPFPHTSISWNFADHQDVFAELDAIVHLAGKGIADGRWTESFKKQIYSSRVETTRQLVEATNTFAKNLKTFISSSAIGIYPFSDQPAKEDDASGEQFLAKVCEDWEQPVHQDLQKNIRAVLLRIGVVLSEDGGALDKIVPAIKAGGGHLGSGQQVMSWIDIDDLVGMFMFSLENESMSGPYNAVAPNPVTNKELTHVIAKELGQNILLPAPSVALRMIVGEMAQTLLSSQAVSSEKIENAGYQFKYHRAEESITKRVLKLKSNEFRKVYQTWLPGTLGDVFRFFSDEMNLEKITPPELHFQVIGKNTDRIESGTLIDYNLKLSGIPFGWRTKILDWDPPKRFTDTQLKGPYKKWHHTHYFETLGEGVLMTDIVDYMIPLGLLGRLAAGWKVHRDVEKIFDFRNKEIRKYFT